MGLGSRERLGTLRTAVAHAVDTSVERSVVATTTTWFGEQDGGTDLRLHLIRVSVSVSVRVRVRVRVRARVRVIELELKLGLAFASP